MAPPLPVRRRPPGHRHPSQHGSEGRGQSPRDYGDPVPAIGTPPPAAATRRRRRSPGAGVAVLVAGAGTGVACGCNPTMGTAASRRGIPARCCTVPCTAQLGPRRRRSRRGAHPSQPRRRHPLPTTRIPTAAHHPGHPRPPAAACRRVRFRRSCHRTGRKAGRACGLARMMVMRRPHAWTPPRRLHPTRLHPRPPTTSGSKALETGLAST